MPYGRDTFGLDNEKGRWGRCEKGGSPVVYLPLLVDAVAGLLAGEPSQPGSLHGSPASSW